jgi:hypothetical protein
MSAAVIALAVVGPLFIIAILVIVVIVYCVCRYVYHYVKQHVFG